MYLHFLGLISAVECVLCEYQNQRPITTKENVTWSQPEKLIDHVAIGFFFPLFSTKGAPAFFEIHH